MSITINRPEAGKTVQNVALKILEAETSKTAAVCPTAEGKREADRQNMSLEYST